MKHRTAAHGRITALLVAGIVTVAVRAADLPFLETFESRATGYLDGQNGWTGTREGDAVVQTDTVHDGNRAAVIGAGGTLSRTFSDTDATNVWVDLSLRTQHAASTNQPVISHHAAAGVYIGTNGLLMGYSNDTWVALGQRVESNTWYRLNVHLNYETRKWALYMADDGANRLAAPVATNLAFQATATNTWLHRLRIRK